MDAGGFLRRGRLLRHIGLRRQRVAGSKHRESIQIVRARFLCKAHPQNSSRSRRLLAVYDRAGVLVHPLVLAQRCDHLHSLVELRRPQQPIPNFFGG